jgi:cytidyltransferase-like protein
MKYVTLITGGFDPVHSGHIQYIQDAKKRGDLLVIGLNSDAWLARKKGQAFMPFSERKAILEALRGVDYVIDFDDSDGTARDAINQTLAKFPDQTVIFANGGDRTKENIPEMDIASPRLQFVFGVGGENKANSSSWILTEWKNPRTERVWGYYRNLHSDGPNVKVKELAVNPGAKLSMQKHQHRSEHWHVSTGVATVNISYTGPEDYVTHTLAKHGTIDIPVDTWHQLCNNTDEIVKVVEIQFGTNCIEEDIIRHGVDPFYGKDVK